MRTISREDSCVSLGNEKRGVEHASSSSTFDSSLSHCSFVSGTLRGCLGDVWSDNDVNDVRVGAYGSNEDSLIFKKVSKNVENTITGQDKESCLPNEACENPQRLHANLHNCG